MMFISKSKIHFESKSQHTLIMKLLEDRCLSVSQRYILKANHNLPDQQPTILKMFISKSKIHFESKSQLWILPDDAEERCLSVSQRYILKANHNKWNSTSLN